METASDFRGPEREHRSMLSSLEKTALLWIAQRLPPWVNSDHLTTLGFVSLIGVGLSYWYARRSTAGLVWAIVFFVMNWFGDSLGRHAGARAAKATAALRILCRSRARRLRQRVRIWRAGAFRLHE